MDIESIKTKHTELNEQLKKAISTMQFSEQVFIIREAIKDLQRICPHNSGNYDFSSTDECPYCGKHFGA